MMYKKPEEVVFVFESQEKLYTGWFIGNYFLHSGGIPLWLQTEPEGQMMVFIGLNKKLK